MAEERHISKDFLPQALSDIEERIRLAFVDQPLTSIKLDLLHKEPDKLKVSHKKIIVSELSPNVYYVAHLSFNSPCISKMVIVIPLATTLVGLKRDTRGVIAGFISWWGTLLNASIPTTIIEKRLVGIFGKRVFIPYYKSEEIIDANKIFKNRENWNPLLDKLNSDEKLKEEIGLLKTEFRVEYYGPWYFDLGSYKAKLDDMGLRPWESFIIAIPAGYKTLLMGFYPIHEDSARMFVNALFDVARHIIEFNYNVESYGLIPEGRKSAARVLYGLLSKDSE